jgi:hypothetical protein
MVPDVRHIDLSYDNANSRESALRLITTLFPEWASSRDTIEFVQFKDGITNTVRSRESSNILYPWAGIGLTLFLRVAPEGGEQAARTV